MTQVLVCLALALAEGELTKQNEKELANPRGTWRLMAVEADGEDLSLDVHAKFSKITITAEKIAFFGKKPAQEYELRINPKKNPKEMDLLEKGKVYMLTIYSVKGDELRIAYLAGPQMRERPVSFDVKKVKENDQIGYLVLYILKRSKDK